jgi:hypothetical protein
MINSLHKCFKCLQEYEKNKLIKKGNFYWCSTCFKKAQESKQKKCKICLTKEELIIIPSSGTYCKKCYEVHKLNKENWLHCKKCKIKGNSNTLITFKRISYCKKCYKEITQENIEKNIKKCKICGTKENLRQTRNQSDKINICNICNDCFKKNKIERGEKIKKGVLIKYGVENAVFIKEVKQKRFLKNRLKKINHIFDEAKKNNLTPEFTKDDFLTTEGSFFNFICNKCGKLKSINVFKKIYCKECELHWTQTGKFINGRSTEKFKQTSKKTCLDKYGVDHYCKSKKYKQEIIFINRKKRKSIYYKQFEMKKIIPLFTEEEFLEKENLKFKCERCNEIFENKVYSLMRCSCQKKSGKSQQETEINDFINSLGFETITNKQHKNENNKHLELDIFIPSKNLGIEFNGTWWHQDLYRNENYHNFKYNFFKEKGIRLIQVIDIDWTEKEEIVKSIIKNALGKSEVIFARKCKIKQISNKEKQSYS